MCIRDRSNAFLATTNGNSGYNDVELYTPQSSGAVTIYMDMNAVNSTGATYPVSHSNLMPFINLNYIIALNGLYPSQY
jgi:microcystin-dependent protein